MSLVFNIESASRGLVRDPTPEFSTQWVWGLGSGAEGSISSTFPGEAGGAGHTWRSTLLHKGSTVGGRGVSVQKQESWFLKADMGVGTRVRNTEGWSPVSLQGTASSSLPLLRWVLTDTQPRVGRWENTPGPPAAKSVPEAGYTRGRPGQTKTG